MPVTLATFNVKNLLEPTTAAARRVMPGKVAHIAGGLRECDADVIGLQEVGSGALLAQVLGHPDAPRGYQIQMGTTDKRGIACALLSRLPVLESRVHTSEALVFPRFQQDDPAPFDGRIPLRRGIVHAQVAAPGMAPVDVLVAHFKSSRPVPGRDPGGAVLEPRTARAFAEGFLRSLVWRAAEALFVREIVDGILAARPDALIAAVGDFNDLPGSPVLRVLRGEGDGALLDCTTEVDPPRRFSHFHDGRPCQIDHVLATQGLRRRLQDARFLNDALRAHDPLPDDGDETPTVDSDHAPLVVRFG